MPAESTKTTHFPMGVDCSWCGSDHTDRPDGKPYRDRGGDPFCSKSHRDASTRALRRFLERMAQATHR